MIRRLQKTVFDVLIVPVEKRKVEEVQELLGSYLAGVDFFRGTQLTNLSTFCTKESQ